MKPQPTQVRHSAEFSCRRRALFPSNENNSDDDSGLGCINPLNYDDTETLPVKLDSFSLKKTVGDYDIIGIVENIPEIINTPINNKHDPANSTNTPLNVPLTNPADTITPNSSSIDKESPSQKLKTPHDLSNNSKLPKLTRKSTGGDLAEDLTGDKNPKKVRTALFPEFDMPVPPKTFYSQTAETSFRSHISSSGSVKQRSASRKENLYLCSKRRGRKGFGQINAGVRHKIKKLKKTKKKLKSAALIKHALKENLSIVNLNGNAKLKEIETVLSENSNFNKEAEEREPSPEPEPDPTKKFFKSSRHRGVFTLNKNIQVKVDHGKVTLMEPKANLKRTKKSHNFISKRLKLDISENEFGQVDKNEEPPVISSNHILNIIETLEEPEIVEKTQNPNILMSPTSVMCDMASGLAINSPKKMKNLNTVLDKMPNLGDDQKLFPVFYPGSTAMPNNSPSARNKNSSKKFRAISKDQMLLDAGQKKFGTKQCPQCEIVYHQGDPADEIMHERYHNSEHVFRFSGWKNERVIADDFLGGKIIKVIPADSKIWWKKVNDVVNVVNRDLGFYEIDSNITNCQVFLYIKNRKIVGVLVAELKNKAHKLLTSPEDDVDMCSEESYTIKCGVSRIWISPNYRKQGIASALMNSMRKNFMFGYILRNEDIALSSPTQAGKHFGRSYFKTPNFLIYIN